MDLQRPQGRLFASYPLPLGLAVFLVQVAMGGILFATFQQYVPNHLGAGDAWGGYLVAAYGLARFASETPAGALSDRIERRLGLLAGFLLMIPPIAVMTMVETPAVYLALAAVLGLSTAFLWPAAYAISADFYPPGRRGKVIGFLNLAQLFGFGVGALAGALTVDRSATALFIGGVAVVLLGVATVAVGMPNYRGGSLFTRVVTEERPPLRSVLSARLVMLSAIVLASSIALSMLFPVIRPYGTRQLGVSFAEIAVALIPSVVAGSLLYVPAGHLADRFGRTLPFVGGLVLVITGLLVLAATETMAVAMVAAAAVFCGNVLTVPAWNAAVMDLAPATHRGTLIGLTVALNGLGLAAGPALGGLATGALGPPDTLRLSAALCGATAAAVLGYRWLFGPGHQAE